MTVTTRGAGAPAVGYLEHTREPLLRHLVGGILRRTRRDQRRTLQDVAVEARVSTAYLSEVERGRKEASSEVLAAVCDALGMRLVDLVERAWTELALANDARVVDLTRSAPAGFRPGRDGAPGAVSGVGRQGEAVLLAA
ncbi:helix-turn-helix transcriptional regulator [Antribacter sp. KLBMP9083]|uniref:Helix-turn-helix transcriptional regulator n=1 Tax=Antribacter soli TaxID=2910976 RepID=A0AA41QAS7_9MICO|nr:helix-turn-helix transcriptional regulator [Antribacter soli]MCF4120025.1 helix-turn-helix transcriptional regulator [Antribacter soli]